MAHRNSPKNHGSQNPIYLYQSLEGKDRANVIEAALRQHVKYADFFFKLENGKFHTSIEQSISFRIFLRGILRFLSPKIFTDE